MSGPSSRCCDDPTNFMSPLPGPRGPKGPSAPGTEGSPGKNAFTLTSSPFTQPAISGDVDVDVVDSSWVVEGQAVFVESGGYYEVGAINSSTSITLTRTAIAGFAGEGDPVASGSQVSPAGYSYVDNSQYSALDARVTTLEEAISGPSIQTYYSDDAPTGDITVGSIWFDTDANYLMHRWDGSGWVAITPSVAIDDFGTGLKPVKVVGTLPSSGNEEGDVAYLTSDKKIYRFDGSNWIAGVAGSDITGTFDGSQLVANSVTTGAIAAGAIVSSHVGTNELITLSANIGSAVIIDSHVSNMSAGKLTAGTISSQIIKISGASGSIESSNYLSGSTGFRIGGSGSAEFNDVTIRGRLEASSIRTDSSLFNGSAPSNTMGASSWRNAQANNGGAGYSSLSNTEIWMTTFYGWTHASGVYANRFGKATMQFDCFENGGCTPAGGSYVDLVIIYRVNGGTTNQVTPFNSRALAGNGTLNHVGGVEISGLSGGDRIEFGVRASSDNASSVLNVANLTVRCFNF